MPDIYLWRSFSLNSRYSVVFLGSTLQFIKQIAGSFSSIKRGFSTLSHRSTNKTPDRSPVSLVGNQRKIFDLTWEQVQQTTFPYKMLSIPACFFHSLSSELLWQIMMCACWLLCFSSALTSSPLLIKDKDFILTPVLLTISLWKSI